MSDPKDPQDQSDRDVQPLAEERTNADELTENDVSDVVDTTGLTEADDEHVNRAEGPVL